MVDGAVRPTYYQRPPSVVSVCLRKKQSPFGTRNKKEEEEHNLISRKRTGFLHPAKQTFPPNCLDLPPKDILRA